MKSQCHLSFVSINGGNALKYYVSINGGKIIFKYYVRNTGKMLFKYFALTMKGKWYKDIKRKCTFNLC